MGISLSIKELFINPTIKEIASYIENNINNLSITRMSLDNDHVFQMSSGDENPIIFFVSGITGICGGLEELSRALSANFQVYGLHMIGLFENEIPLRTIEEIASQNIKWMKSIQPNGPYYFLGHSYAGYIVYEMARQLAENGDKIALPIIIDTNPNFIVKSKNSKEDFILFTKEMFENYHMIEKFHPNWIQKLKNEILNITIEETPSYIENAFRNLFPVLDENIKFVIRAVTLQANNHLIEYKLRQKIDTDSMILIASNSDYNEISGWSKYFQDSYISVLPGTHGSIVESENANEIARLIKTNIEMKNRMT
jgi:thioesterase domain-containing protein